jgi:hypothetical protein
MFSNFRHNPRLLMVSRTPKVTQSDDPVLRSFLTIPAALSYAETNIHEGELAIVVMPGIYPEPVELNRPKTFIVGDVPERAVVRLCGGLTVNADGCGLSHCALLSGAEHTLRVRGSGLVMVDVMLRGYGPLLDAAEGDLSLSRCDFSSLSTESLALLRNTQCTMVDSQFNGAFALQVDGGALLADRCAIQGRVVGSGSPVLRFGWSRLSQRVETDGPLISDWTSISGE